MKKKCPTCLKTSGVRRVVWGMPMFDEEIDESKYYIGGCIVPDGMPDWACVDCEILFLKTPRKEIPSHIELGPSIQPM